MKEVILYVYGLGDTLVVFTEPQPIFKKVMGRMIGIETDLPIASGKTPKEGDVVCCLPRMDESKNYLVIELCDSAMKSFQ